MKAGASRRNVRFASAYLQVGFSPWLDWRPLMRLSVRDSPALLDRPSVTLPSRLLVRRPLTEAGLVSGSFVADGVRCFGVGRRLLRRLVAALGGRDARRAAGLSSSPGVVLFGSTVDTRRLDADVLGLA